MKIGIYDPYLDALGGGEKYMMSIAECLSNDHEVTILWDNEYDIEKVEDRFSLDLEKCAIEKNIFSPQISFLKRQALSKKYDAIIYLSDGSIPIVRSKLYLHFQHPVEWVNVTFKTKLKLKKVSGIFCNSEFTKRFIDKKLNVKSKIIYPPVIVKKLNVPKENIILHVGRFQKTGVEGQDFKKQYFMIDTFKKMVDADIRDWKLVMAVSVKSQDLQDFRHMQEKAAGYPISFLINVTNNELWTVYSKSKIYWHASGFGEDLDKYPERAEHFGISTVEAMGAGAVPVVINAGGQKEIVEDGKNGLLWNTQEEMILLTKDLIDHSKKLAELAKNAEKVSSQYSRNVFCKHVTDLIQ